MIDPRLFDRRRRSAPSSRPPQHRRQCHIYGVGIVRAQRLSASMRTLGRLHIQPTAVSHADHDNVSREQPLLRCRPQYILSRIDHC